MKVFIVTLEYCYGYEDHGTSIMGVFGSEEQANDYAKRLNSNPRKMDGDDYMVDHYILNKEAE